MRGGHGAHLKRSIGSRWLWEVRRDPGWHFVWASGQWLDTAAADAATIQIQRDITRSARSRHRRLGLAQGTSLWHHPVDLESRHVVDLLPDRERETVAAWLRTHGCAEIVSRDRASAYAEAARSAAADGCACSAWDYVLRADRHT
jgi:hypothetical protein